MGLLDKAKEYEKKLKEEEEELEHVLYRKRRIVELDKSGRDEEEILGEKKRRVSPAGCRRKGSKFEREIAKKFAAAYKYTGDRIRRGNQTRFGHDGADVETPHFWVECKNHTRPNVRRAISQARDYIKKRNDNRWALAVTKGLREPVLATMYFDDFCKLVELAGLNVPEDF
jgi:hypothetical protein